MRLAYASAVLVASLSYLAYVFRIPQGTLWTAGAGDWIDPYFINALLEHWYRSASHLSDPSSPPMYFPVRRTLGYSHGLVLFAPLYSVLRLFVHPFQAYNLTLLLVIESGIVCLYLLLRRYFRLSFFEALLLSAFFFTSRNVINGGTGVWSQRASVFLIPPILLILLLSTRLPARPRTLVLAWVSGLLATLLFTQDFYTGHLALLFVALFLPAAVLIESGRPLSTRLATLATAERRVGATVALASTALGAAWTLYVWLSGGGAVQVLGVRITSHDVWRPALVTAVALLAFVWLRGGVRVTCPAAPGKPWLIAFTLGALAGSFLFLWIYLGAYREHRAFPEEHLINSLERRDLSRSGSAWEFMRDLSAYDTSRPFAFAFVLAILVWLPPFNVDGRSRRYALWLLGVSVLVLAVPLTVGEFSIWRALFARLPGFAVIRDPKRIIALHELTVVLVAALVLTRIPARSACRLSASAVILVLLVVDRNPESFDFLRPKHTYERWVAAPIAVDPSCRSFFIRAASETYSSRSDNMWALYGVDSLFVALNHSLPTLNGYSAWHPTGWALTNPRDAGYTEAVAQWVERHALTGVCEFDVDARTMKPYHRKAPTP